MNRDHQIYELTENQRRALAGEHADEQGDGYDEEQVATMREDVRSWLIEGLLREGPKADLGTRLASSRPNADLGRRKSA